MVTIGCTLIQKSWGLSCDVMLAYDQGNWLGRWDRLKHPVRPPTKFVPSLQFGTEGDLVQARDTYKGKERSFMSLYPPRTWAADPNKAASPAHVHIFCGTWSSVIERVGCGNFVSGEAILWRTREPIEFELWFACS
ncbi:MAG TPA: hypothetical protein PKE66_10720 [Pyrinomonadaceae bacterium]|nr:hypothetical protein [Pyrinomonadaceae bacterium]